MPYLTPDSAGTSSTLTISVPDTFLPALLGAIHELTLPELWEEYGNLTPEETAEQMHDAFAARTVTADE